MRRTGADLRQTALRLITISHIDTFPTGEMNLLLSQRFEANVEVVCGGPCNYLCAAGDGTLQELGNIDMVDSTPSSQQC